MGRYDNHYTWRLVHLYSWRGAALPRVVSTWTGVVVGRTVVPEMKRACQCTTV